MSISNISYIIFGCLAGMKNFTVLLFWCFTASLHRLAGRYDNPTPESTVNLATDEHVEQWANSLIPNFATFTFLQTKYLQGVCKASSITFCKKIIFPDDKTVFWIFMKGGRSANKFLKSQIRKFADIHNLLDVRTFRKGGTLRICDLWTESFCDLRI
jgi:hypothetical protein